MSDKYIFDGKNVKPCDDLMTWARWYEKADRRVAETFTWRYRISTIFLGLDHSFGCGDPLLFETMVFGGKDDMCERCSTFEQAKEQHKRVCERLQNPWVRKLKQSMSRLGNILRGTV